MQRRHRTRRKRALARCSRIDRHGVVELGHGRSKARERMGELSEARECKEGGRVRRLRLGTWGGGGEVDFHGTWASAELRETDGRLKGEG
jgi:hypothetical protein